MLVNNAANCVPPFSPSEAKKIGLKVNINFGAMMMALAEARRQLLNAFWKNNYFFKIKIPMAPADHQSEWEAFITEIINGYLRDSLEYFELHDSRWTSVASHGVGPMQWMNPDDWCPEYIALSDLRIPTDTYINRKNQDWYALRKPWTPGELLVEAFAPGSGNKWYKKGVWDILKNYKNINWDFGQSNYNLETDAEKIAELVRQDGAFFMGDAQPVIPLWHFYFKDETDPDNAGWFMRVVPETAAMRASPKEPDKFLWDSDKPQAAKLSHLFHCQFGDISNDAPVKFHAVRGIGHALLEPWFHDNFTLCRMLQHVHDNFNIWLRSADPAGKARAQVQQFANLGVLHPGLSVIPANERHQVETGNVEFVLAQTREMQQRVSSTYNQSPDTGTQREETAFAVGVKVQQLNAMLASILMRAFIYETHADKEICRRFCRPNSKNEDVKDFQKQCADMKIPRQWLDIKYWRVEAVTPLGMGNPTMALAATQQLLELSPQLDPSAQQEIKHEAVIVYSGDPRKAARWVPLSAKTMTTQGGTVSQAMFGSLMTGVEFNPPEGTSPIEQIDAMLPLLAGKISMLEKRDNMATADEAMGLKAVGDYIGKLIQRVAQDEQEKERVKKYGDDLGELMNLAKALSQRGAEAKEKQVQNSNGQIDPMAYAKVHGFMMQQAAKAKVTAAKAGMKEKMDNERFIREQRREDAKAHAEIQREQVKNRMKGFEE